MMKLFLPEFIDRSNVQDYKKYQILIDLMHSFKQLNSLFICSLLYIT